MCSEDFQGDALLLPWVLGTAWEILTLCLAVWIAVKHFRELQGPPTRWTVGDSFKVLLKTHLFYFARSAVRSRFHRCDYPMFPAQLPL